MTGERTMTGDRLHIGIFGRRNSGKSSLINALTGQNIAIVSATPGTTTDPVYKSMELQPLGPVVFIDTAGLDDVDQGLGRERKARALRVFQKTDFALLVIDGATTDLALEQEWLRELQKRRIPFLLVINKADQALSPAVAAWQADHKDALLVSAIRGDGLAELRQRILSTAPREWEQPFLRDLIHPGDLVLLVTPIDLGAARGRLIMPQVKAIRDVLDGDAVAVVVKERELPATMGRLLAKPALVVTDSQVLPQVAADVPDEIPLTTFSILSIRQKGDLRRMVEGVRALTGLKPGDRVLIAESCSHHPLEDDIGRVKIPRWLNHAVGGGLQVDIFPGTEYPDDLEKYKLVVHCGGCTLNRREMLRRQKAPEVCGVPMTNYGVLIAWLKSVFPRVLRLFPECADLLDSGAEKAAAGKGSSVARLTEA